MITVALKGLLGRKLRAVLTAVSIVLGVAMISGTFVLTDTIKAAFGTVFNQVYKNTDAVITGKSAIGGSANEGVTPPSLPESLLSKVRGLPGVAVAEGGISDEAKLVGRDGKVVTAHGGAPSLAFSVNPKGDQRFNPLVLTSGHWPSAPHAIAIDEKTAKTKHFAVGDTIGVLTRGPLERFRIVGTVRFGGLTSLGGATIAIFDLSTAQRIFNKEGKLDSIGIASKPNVTPQRLVGEVKEVLPPTAQVRTGQQEAKQAASDTNSFLTILEYFLLAFGFVALFVGIFVIMNTLGITVAQRMRELATLRTLGATKRQVYWSVVLEAVVIGVIASVIGLFLGLALAKALNALFVSLGIDLPQVGTVFKARTAVVALVVGSVVTVIASIRPALRATRVEPIAAVREGAVLPPSRLARFGPYIAVGVIAGALALMLVGLFAGGVSTKLRLLSLGIGALAVFIGVAMLAPTLVPPVARVLGWPAAHWGGAPGLLARGNSIRNPSRTASTASALMIGLTLVTLVAVLAAGLKTTFEDSVNKLFVADYALTSQNGFTPTSIASEKALEGVPGVEVVSGVRAGEAQAFGNRINVTAVEPNVSKVIDLKWQEGSPATPAELGSAGAFVAKSYAKDHHLHIGSPIVLKTPAGGSLLLKLRGVFDPPKGGSPFGDVTISAQRFDHAFANPQDLFSFVKTRGGVTKENTSRLQAALTRFPDAKIQTKSEFTKNQERGINLLLNILYVLLSLSIVISVFGIVTTLVLTVFERTREIGMLRAVGMTRRQVRNMIRHESIITALLGAALAIPLGIVLALMVGKAIDYPAFTIPWVTLVVFLVAAVIAGLLAAIVPARRAARLNVLQALQYE
ncbi:MAG: putative transport system permease protein [Gaiellaceae bacterium]|nr:putative transport system permease protein [Gaiellaceae bacterium]